MFGLICRKYGMSRVIDKNGLYVPITIIETIPNFVTEIKNVDKHGYDAVKIGAKIGKKTNKCIQGITNMSLNFFREFRGICNLNTGDSVDASMFKDDLLLDVVGISKGKGFAGVVKRYNFSLQGASHGVTKSHRGVGSTGMRTSPGRVIPGKKMPGRMGHDRVSIKRVQIVRIDTELRYILVKGSVPGPTHGILLLKKRGNL